MATGRSKLPVLYSHSPVQGRSVHHFCRYPPKISFVPTNASFATVDMSFCFRLQRYKKDLIYANFLKDF
nr:hypothetical protein ELOWGMBK_ELOWGMBK_CDS_0010 [Herelleviridae sp.]CAI9751951.1 hypothetical protein QGKEIAJE_QGKEIAJE_CDS_0009 [uncultured phage]